MKSIESFLKYGIDSSLALKIISIGLNISSLRSLNKNNLKNNFEFEDFEIAQIKDALLRKPIEEDVLNKLLENSGFVCNICKGIKSDAYIIHHIEHYNVSQDNSYENLIVLCPNDHELAHREGEALANKITPNQLFKAKYNWEKKIAERIVTKAVLEGDIFDLDYVNVERILELCLQVFNGEIPKTKYTFTLLSSSTILPTGQINPELYEKYSLNKNTPLKFWAMYGSTMLRFHYFELLLKCMSKFDISDLDDLLNAKSIREGIIGKFCYHIGGVYGRQYKGNISAKSKPTILHFKRKKVRVKWFVDPMYLTSSTATWRISSRSIFIIYGKILNVNKIVEKENNILEITIRPYAYGIPNHHKDRTPIIKYIKESENYEQFFD